MASIALKALFSQSMKLAIAILFNFSALKQIVSLGQILRAIALV